jgi:putative ABC transport system permease protein
MTRPSRRPPKILLWILRRLTVYEDQFAITGDYEAEYAGVRQDHGRGRAFLWLVWNTLEALVYYLLFTLRWSTVMFRNYLKIALRNIGRHKVFSLINIAGLTIGLTCVVLILLWIQDELGFDRFHKNIDDIYLVSALIKAERNELQVPSVPGVGPFLKEVFPEVEESARFLAGNASLILRYQERTFSEPGIFPADPEALEMFTFPLVEGDPKTALRDPHSLVLSERVAKKYFGNESPLNKVITVDDQFPMTVRGVMKDVPANSTFRFDILMPLEFYAKEIDKSEDLRGFSNQNYFVFVQLQKRSSFQDLNRKIRELVVSRYGSDEYIPVLRPFSRFHLYRLGDGGGSIEQIRLVGFLGLFILFIACINFMNLTTARSGGRSKEIGVRKVIGGLRKDVIKQFYLETSMFVLISMGLTLFLSRLFLPVFNTLFQKELRLDVLHNPYLWVFLIGASLATALAAGSYPALFLSSLQPLPIIKGRSGSSLKRSGFHKALVVIQFSLAIGLIAGAIGVYQQLTYLRTMDLGYNMKNLIFVPARGSHGEQYPTAKNEFLRIPGVQKVAAASFYPTGSRSNSTSWQWEGKDPELKPLITELSVDSDFLETLEIPLVRGRFFGPENDSSGNPGSIVINEKLAGIMGRGDPVNTRMSEAGRNYTVIGVIKDYLPNPAWRVDEPLILFQKPEDYRYVFLKVRPENFSQTLAQVRNVFERLNPGFPFEYRFLDASYELQFSSLSRTRSLVAYLAGFAVFISCLGLFGLASFNAAQRTREIGIRKVLGSSAPGIFVLLSKNLTRLVLLANIIAWPAAWYLLNQWLQNFLYRASVRLDIFLIAGALTFLIALATVSYISIKAATARPADSLRYE